MLTGTLLLATGCGGVNVDRTDGLTPGNGWMPVFSYDGTFTAGPNKDELGDLECGYEVECEPDSVHTLVLEGSPVTVTCTGDAFDLTFIASDGDVESPSPYWTCGPSSSSRPSDGSYVEAGWWGAYRISMEQISLPEEIPPGLVRNGKWHIRFWVWGGPWKEPICGVPGSGVPRGEWFSCVGRTMKAQRMTHRDAWEPYDGGA